MRATAATAGSSNAAELSTHSLIAPDRSIGRFFSRRIFCLRRKAALVDCAELRNRLHIPIETEKCVPADSATSTASCLRREVDHAKR